MHKKRNDRRRARAIAKAQCERHARNVVDRAVEYLVKSSESGFAHVPVAPGATVRGGDLLYISTLHPGHVVAQPEQPVYLAAVGTAVLPRGIAVTGGLVRVDLHRRG